MDTREIKRLIRLIEDSGIEEFEMEKDGVRVRIRKPAAAAPPGLHPQPTVLVQDLPPTETAGFPSVPPEPAPIAETSPNHIFEAPIVGTFYITPKPDVESFVSPGSRVTKGTVLCIIEAMKIFNQIECDVDGEIVSILVENGQPVEYGQPLFEIRLTT